MPPAGRFNRTSWPDAGAWREFLEFVDDVHGRFGCPSMRVIAKSMHLQAPRVHDIVRGRSLPVDAEQTRSLVAAIAGESADLVALQTRAVGLFYEARRSKLSRPVGPPGPPDRQPAPRDPADPLDALDPTDPLHPTDPPHPGDPADPADRVDPHDQVATGPRRRAPGALRLTAAVAVALALVTGTAVLTRSMSAPRPVTTPTPAVLGVPPQSVGLAPGQPDVLSVRSDAPGGCSGSYLVSGVVRAPADRDAAAFWVVDVLFASPTHDDPHDLYFAKARITLGPDGGFAVRIPGNREKGARDGRFLLVASPNQAADRDLELSLASDLAHDERYPDVRRTELRLGNGEIATSPDMHQRCP